MKDKWYTLSLRQWLLKDSDSQDYTIEAKVKSGEYFVTLATRLDEISGGINPDKAIQLQMLVNELLYIQKRYKISEEE